MITRYLSIVLIFMMASTTMVNAQKINQKKTGANGREILVGKIDKNGLTQDTYATWFSAQFDNYEVDANTVDSIKKALKKYKIKVFMGTWCGDSKREVPRFYKVLEELDFPMDKLMMVAVDYEKENYKKSPGGEEKGLDIRKVPTFIFYKKGKEVNRIIESPVVSLEKDIAAIVQGKNYVPHHSNAPVLPVD